MTSYAGLQIITNAALTITVEDWSAVRSPGRARRRLKRGFPQRIVRRVVPDPKVYVIRGVAVMHPALMAELDRCSRSEAAWI